MSLSLHHWSLTYIAKLVASMRPSNSAVRVSTPHLQRCPVLQAGLSPLHRLLNPSFLCWSNWEMLMWTLQLWVWDPLHRQAGNGIILSTAAISAVIDLSSPLVYGCSINAGCNPLLQVCGGSLNNRSSTPCCLQPHHVGSSCFAEETRCKCVCVLAEQDCNQHPTGQ